MQKQSSSPPWQGKFPLLFKHGFDGFMLSLETRIQCREYRKLGKGVKRSFGDFSHDVPFFRFSIDCALLMVLDIEIQIMHSRWSQLFSDTFNVCRTVSGKLFNSILFMLISCYSLRGSKREACGTLALLMKHYYKPKFSTKYQKLGKGVKQQF